MSTIGWILILAAGLMMRQVAKGRAQNSMEDLSDAFLSIVSGDTQELGSVLSRTGDYNQPTPAVVEQGMAPASAITGNALVATAVQLGSAASGYRWAKAGPKYYDCSGLMFATVKKHGYTGFRFFTSDLPNAPGMYPIEKPEVGDIVLWRRNGKGHTGIVTGPNKYYSARSVKSGIGYSTISSLTGKGEPRYYRFMPNSDAAKRAALKKNQ
jgi:NlpC/P60 family